MDTKPMSPRRWPVATDPHAMLRHLDDRATDRKLRLFACACCRRASHLASDERFPRWLDDLEEVADQQLKLKSWERAWRECFKAQQSPPNLASSCLLGVLCRALRKELDRDYTWLGESAAMAFAYGAGSNPEWSEKAREYREHTVLIREIFGNPFRPVPVDPSWLTSDVVALATGVYEERAFDRMPILADALQDAGCDSADLLNHLRDPNATHVRGCWALDLVLGKT